MTFIKLLEGTLSKTKVANSNKLFNLNHITTLQKINNNLKLTYKLRCVLFHNQMHLVVFKKLVQFHSKA